MTAPDQQVPEISVILPVYNVAGYLAACLTSLRQQSFENFEVIVVDDGSTDDSAAIARHTIGDDPRFRLITQDNRGLSGARNTGLDQAKGQAIAFVDGDDRVMPDYLSQLWTALQDSGADWVACAIRSCFADGHSTVHSAIHTAPDLGVHPVPRLYALQNWTDVICHFPSAWNKLYRRTLIEGLRFDEGTWFEDHSFFLRASLRTDHLYYIPQPLYLQTQGRDGQITGTDDDRVFQQFSVLRSMREIMHSSPRPGADHGFAQSASRLLFERSTILATPERRQRFAQEAAHFLQEQRLIYTSNWRENIAPSWALEMDGQLPLTIVIPWPNGRAKDQHDALRNTLNSLTRQHGLGREILVVCRSPQDRETAQRLIKDCPLAQVLLQAESRKASAQQCGLDQARGHYLLFLHPGDTLHPNALHDWVNIALSHDADMTLSAFRLGTPPDAPTSSGLYDNGLQTAVTGPLNINGPNALHCAPYLSTRLFKRAFLLEQRLKFLAKARTDIGADWGFALAGALCARKSAYIAWPGVSLACFDTGQTRRKHSVGRIHDEIIRALPQSPDLPQGWQRRIFARILRHNIDTPSPAAPLPRALMLANMVGAGMARGFCGTHRDPAGFDANIGPRLAQILNPLGRLGGQQLVPHSLPPCPSDQKPAPMYLFPLGKRAIARFRVDFHQHDYANLFFRVEAGAHIPFHLSLRLKEQQVVCNDSHPDGRWRAERIREFDLKPQGHEVEIELIPPHVRVIIDGVELFHLVRRLPWKRSGVTALERITHLEIEGGLYPTDLIPQEPPKASLELDKRLMLRAACPPEGLTLKQGTAILPLSAARLSQGQAGLTALPTGQIWISGKDSVTFHLSNGSQLTLTRSEMARRITEVLDHRLTPKDAALSALVLEHIRLGALLPLLSPDTQNSAFKLARSLGLSKYIAPLPQDSARPAQDQPASISVEIDPITAEIDRAVAQFTHSLEHGRATGTPVDPAQLLAGLTLSKAARRGLYLALSEPFCSAGLEFETLFDAACADGMQRFHPVIPKPISTTPPSTDMAPPQSGATDLWSVSAMLPFLLLNLQADDLDDAIWALSKPTTDWVLTAPIAWTVRHAQTLPGLPDAIRERVIYAYFTFAGQHAQNYWDRAHCRELTACAVWLLGHLQRDDYMRHDLEEFCLKTYGLSRQFWAEVHSQNVTLSPKMRLGRAFFETLNTHRPRPSEAEVDRALRFFEAYGTPDASRLRVETLGPAGCPQSSPLPLSSLVTPPTHGANAPTAAQSAIRHMAFPGSGAVTADVADLAQDGLADLYPLVPRARRFGAQLTASHKAQAALDPANQAGPTDEELIAAFAPLVGDEDGFLGIGLALSMVAARLERGQTTPGLVDWIDAEIAALPAPLLVSLSHAAPLVSPLGRLARLDDPIAKRLCSTLNAPAGLDNPSGLPAASPLYDTLVTVFSCRAYLHDRIPALRATWLKMLDDLDIPYVIIVGDGDGRCDGDVLHLEAPDDYEGLPQKTLATLNWVHSQTNYAHMLKIDDDCFLNVPLFFQSLSYRKHHYYGRKLTRVAGQMDRAWHQEKSTSPRGRLELDKSPEPSSYADGGSGYTLSRTAMAAALSAAASPAGQRLIATSFMEDKLLGDLLALRAIHICEEDYRICIRRRPFKEAIPVSAWLNSFLPSRHAPLHLVHLDNHHDLPIATEQLNASDLRPRKIWPSFQTAQLGYQSNALELISSDASVQAAREAEVAVVACMRNEMFMLPHFLAHYRRLGVSAFLIADNSSDDGTLEYLAKQPDVALFSVDTDYNKSRYGVAWQQAMLAAFRMHKWSLVADADELLVWQTKQTQTLPDLLKSAEFQEAEAARIFMLDMYPQGPLEAAEFTSASPFEEAGFADRTPFLTNSPMRGPYCDAPAWTSALRHRLIPGSRPNLFVAQKLALLRYHPFMRLSAGLHFVGDVKLAKRELIFGHFKYNAAFREKAQAEVARGQHFNDAEEYRKYLALASEGRSVIYNADLSTPWHQSPFVRARLDH